MDLATQTKRLSANFNPHILQTSDAVFRFQFDTAEDLYLVIDGDRLSLTTESQSVPTLTCYVDTPETLWGLLDGTIDGMAAFMDGRYKADGHIVLSQLLLYAFRSENPAITYEVQD